MELQKFENLLDILNIFLYIQACQLFRIANEAKAFAHKTAAEAWARTEMALSGKFSIFYLFHILIRFYYIISK